MGLFLNTPKRPFLTLNAKNKAFLQVFHSNGLIQRQSSFGPASQAVVTQSTKSSLVIIIHSWEPPIKTEKMRAPKLDPTAALAKHNRPKMSLSNLIYTLFLSGLLFAVEAALLGSYHHCTTMPCIGYWRELST